MGTEASGQTTDPAAQVPDAAAQAAAQAAATAAATATAKPDDAAAKAAADAAAAAAAQTPEAKAKAEADAKAAADAAAAAAKGKVPEKYEDFKLPDGVTLDAPVMDKFTAAAKKHGLNQEAAQELASIGAEIALNAKGTVEATLTKAREEWSASAKSDKEIGGEQFDANLGAANQVFKAFGTPELGKLLIDSGLGDHPELIRWAYRVSKAISPDAIVNGRQTGAPRDPASVLYDAPKKAA